MATKVELESKISGLEFIIKSIMDRVDSEISLCKEFDKPGRVMSDYEKGMRSGELYQAEYLKEAFKKIIESGGLLEKEFIRINKSK